MNRILETNPVDLYEIIAEVCPEQKDLKNKSLAQVTNEIAELIAESQNQT